MAEGKGLQGWRAALVGLVLTVAGAGLAIVAQVWVTKAIAGPPHLQIVAFNAHDLKVGNPVRSDFVVENDGGRTATNCTAQWAYGDAKTFAVPKAGSFFIAAGDRAEVQLDGPGNPSFQWRYRSGVLQTTVVVFCDESIYTGKVEAINVP